MYVYTEIIFFHNDQIWMIIMNQKMMFIVWMDQTQQTQQNKTKQKSSYENRTKIWTFNRIRIYIISTASFFRPFQWTKKIDNWWNNNIFFRKKFQEKNINIFCEIEKKFPWKTHKHEQKCTNNPLSLTKFLY